ncbi:MAG: hypothetical protein V1758_06015 [Pseudomonadota bacterium]
MYVVVEKNRLKVSVAGFYNMAWYGKEQLLDKKEEYPIDYGHLEIDVHRNGKKYLTGFVIDPREFIVDYLKTRYKKRLAVPKNIQSVSVDTGDHHEMLSVDFMKARSFVVDEMEKDLIFPQFCQRKGNITIQGFEALSIFSMIQYLALRFKYRGTRMIRQGDIAYDLRTKRHRKIRLGETRKAKG